MSRTSACKFRQRFDDGLVVADDLVDHQPDAVIAGGHDDHFLVTVGRRCRPGQLPQAQIRHEVATDIQETAAPGNGRRHRRRVRRAFLSGRWRQDVATVADADQQAVDDRERQRQPQGQFGPLAPACW